jgi:hypothetical protein
VGRKLTISVKELHDLQFGMSVPELRETFVARAALKGRAGSSLHTHTPSPWATATLSSLESEST